MTVTVDHGLRKNRFVRALRALQCTPAAKSLAGGMLAASCMASAFGAQPPSVDSLSRVCVVLAAVASAVACLLGDVVATLGASLRLEAYPTPVPALFGQPRLTLDAWAAELQSIARAVEPPALACGPGHLAFGASPPLAECLAPAATGWLLLAILVAVEFVVQRALDSRDPS